MVKSSLKRRILNAGAIWISYFKLVPDLFRLNKHSTVIDCGANVGHISKLLSRTGATVIAFEPDPLAFEQLRKRCGAKSNITLINKGVWDKQTVLNLYSHEEADGKDSSFTVGSSIIAEKNNVNTAAARQIEVIDLIAFLQEQKKPIDLIKLDVEGAEIEILKAIIERNAHNLFGRMYVETHETKIPSQKAELEVIRKAFKEKGIRNIKLNWI
jgi:FkbM family methyltransferase